MSCREEMNPMSKKSLVQQLIDDYGVRKETIAIETGASVRSVERWYKGGKSAPMRVYQEKMQEMIDKKEQEDGDALK